MAKIYFVENAVRPPWPFYTASDGGTDVAEKANALRLAFASARKEGRLIAVNSTAENDNQVTALVNPDWIGMIMD